MRDPRPTTSFRLVFQAAGRTFEVVPGALRNRCVPAENLDRLLRGAGRGDGRLRIPRRGRFRGFLQGRLVRVLTLELAHIHETADAKALRRVAGDLTRRQKERAPAARLFHGGTAPCKYSVA